MIGIDLLTLGAALLGGLLGSVHCVVMCGGIATGFSARGSGGWRRALEPNLGRIGGYALAGLLAGGFGHGIVSLAQMPWLTLVSRLLLGLVLVIVALRLLDRRGRLAFLNKPGSALWRWLRPLQQKLLPADSSARRIGLGVLWGWMPCGLSSTLLAAAWLQADALNGALTMLAFGLGTLPMMLPLTWSGQRLGQKFAQSGWRTALAGLILGAGLLTLSAPWLMRFPALHGVLGLLGCVASPA